MRLQHPTPESYDVEDYEFVFASGIVHPVSYIPHFGDVVDWDTSPLAVKFSIAGRPSPADPEAFTKPEEQTIMMQHVIMITKRTRQVTPPTKEEADLFRQSLLPLPKTVQ